VAAPPRFDIDLPAPRVEPTPRWVRVRAGDDWVADSRRALLLAWYGRGMLPSYWLPAEDVRTELLRRSSKADDGPISAYDLHAGEDVLEGVARLFYDPPPELAAVRDHWTFTWDGRVSWFEEATEVFVHARDPSKRVDVLPSARHVRVELAGEPVAESRRPHALFETGLPTRWYLPPEDVRLDLLEPSETVTRCPYKGTARFWSARAGGELHRDVAWSYPDPVIECPRIAGLIAFFNERVDLVIDGERRPRPFTPWSLGPTGVTAAG
jgi:uncharacterized protein (DUF427 family)